ncbi:MAG TPA: hypothetical protein VET82_00245, partial [Candidatus Eisenbacteria bacterium]|nr:hypothetical protein [Candidatus Eisenbacteria bacterium]
MGTTHIFLRTARYESDDEDDELISRSTWSLKLSGLVFGVLLVIGRSASYGNITWTPAFHHAGSPLTVVASPARPQPIPAIPKTLPAPDWAAVSKRSAAQEVVTFSPGKNSEGTQEGNDNVSSGNDGEATAHAAESPSDTAESPLPPASAHTAMESAT